MTDIVREKIESIRKSGATAYSEGKVKLFTSFPEMLINRFNVSIVSSGKNYLMWQVYKETRKAGLESLFADLDYPLHSTVLECVWEGSEEDRGEAFGDLEKEVRIILGDIVTVSPVSSELVLDANGNLLLMGLEIPYLVLRFREKLNTEFVKCGFRTLPLDNMFHSTIQRLLDVPGNTPDALRRYAKFVGKPNRYEQPLTPSTYPYCGPVLDLLNTRP